MERKTAAERVVKLNEALAPAGYEIRPEDGCAVTMGPSGRFRTTLGIHDSGTGERVALAGSEGDILWFLAEHCGFGRVDRKQGLRGGPPQEEQIGSRVRRRLERAIRVGFPTDTVDISDGYGNNIHIVVVSRRFDNMPERNRLDLLDGLIDAAGLSREQRGLISLMLAWSVSELLALYGHECTSTGGSEG